MKIPTIPKIIIQSILGPLISVFLVSRFNLFDFITFVPEEHRFEVGLTLYLAFVEAFWKYIDWIIERNSASVRCTFFVKEAEKDIENADAYGKEKQKTHELRDKLPYLSALPEHARYVFPEEISIQRCAEIIKRIIDDIDEAQ